MSDYDPFAGAMKNARQDIRRQDESMLRDVPQMIGSNAASPTHDGLVSINIELDSLEKGFAMLEERLRIVLMPPSPENEPSGREQRAPATPLQESLFAIISRIMYLRRVLNHLASRIDL